MSRADRILGLTYAQRRTLYALLALEGAPTTADDVASWTDLAQSHQKRTLLDLQRAGLARPCTPSERPVPINVPGLRRIEWTLTPQGARMIFRLNQEGQANRHRTLRPSERAARARRRIQEASFPDDVA